MKGRIVSASLIALLGLLILLAPHSIAPVCEKTITTAAGMEIPMKCFWTGRTASVMGAIILLGGILLAFSTSASFRAGIAAMLLPVAIVTGLLPTHIIGVCANPMMPCRMITLPVLCLLALFTGLIALGILIASVRIMRRGACAHRRIGG